MPKINYFILLIFIDFLKLAAEKFTIVVIFADAWAFLSSC